ncbi:hypothetical protein [Nocardia gipuzkoensis]|uniref:hypothetical protein n=1 Tax=Nocardia gipuzkoensis TaxID=2749991 RepID=UPI003EDEB5C6
MGLTSHNNPPPPGSPPEAYQPWPVLSNCAVWLVTMPPCSVGLDRQWLTLPSRSV